MKKLKIELQTLTEIIWFSFMCMWCCTGEVSNWVAAIVLFDICNSDQHSICCSRGVSVFFSTPDKNR